MKRKQYNAIQDSFYHSLMIQKYITNLSACHFPRFSSYHREVTVVCIRRDKNSSSLFLFH